MPYKKYPLEPDGPRRLDISWASLSPKRTITLDGYPVGEIPNAKARRKGQTFTLPDGSTLQVKQASKFGISELQVSRNGVPLPGSDADPQHRLDITFRAIVWIAGLNIAVGIVLFMGYASKGYYSNIGYNQYDAFAAILTGLIYGGLSYFVHRRSMVALVITVIGFVIDSLGFLLVGLSPAYLVGRLFLLLYILRGIGALRALKRAEPPPPPVRKPTRTVVNEPQTPSKYRSMLDQAPDAAVTVAQSTPKKQVSQPIRQQSPGEIAAMVAVGFVVLVVIGGLGVAFFSRLIDAPSVVVQPTPQPVLATPTPYPTQPPLLPTQPTPLFVMGAPSNNNADAVQPVATFSPIPPTATLSITPTFIYPVANQSGYTLQLNINRRTAAKPRNVAASTSAEPYYPGDIAWTKPVFASTYDDDYYPSGVTSGLGVGWRTASSDGTWMYVDLGTPQVIHQIVAVHFVDADFAQSPQYYYMVSDDVQTWRVVAHEIDTANTTHPSEPRIITLPEDVTARYVGLYAADWDSGWGEVDLFAVFPPGFEYTADQLNALHPA